MKNWLKNTLMAGSFLAGGLSGFSQNSQSDYDKEFSKWLSQDWKSYKTEVNEAPRYCSSDSSKNENKTIDFKDAMKKLGIEDYDYRKLNDLGHGYVTLRPEHGSTFDKNYRNLRIIDGIRDGFIELDYNGKKEDPNGRLLGFPSEETLEYVDCIENDRVLTREEINKTLNKEYEKAFLDYASSELEVPKDSIVNVGKGYVTSKNLEGKLEKLGEIYEKLAGEPIENFYDYMSKEDAVITKDEMIQTKNKLKNIWRK